tara:strand:- start:96 stop:1109 length:1014 start_codon:yes stop_codon:yes gene_type:complete
MNDLLKEAIADAKAVRETALANAKIALEEAFTPRLQSMLSAKISEEEEMEEAEDPVETNSDGMDAAAGAEAPAPAEEPMAEEEDMDEGDYGSDMEEGEHGDMEEGEHGDMDEMGGDDMEEDLELEAIIKELEEELEENLDDSGIGAGDNKVDMDASKTEDPGEGDLTEEEEKVDEGEKEDMDEDISLDEIIKALREEEDMDEGEDEKMDEGEEEKVDEAKDEELKEAYDVIKFLKSKINEVNLLNAKLLFSNKLFRNYSLNESQKMKVIENFDRAGNLREVKLIYSTLAEGFSLNKTKRQIKESYASKPAGKSTAPRKQVLSEGNDLAARWKKLANL